MSRRPATDAPTRCTSLPPQRRVLAMADGTSVAWSGATVAAWVASLPALGSKPIDTLPPPSRRARLRTVAAATTSRRANDCTAASISQASAAPPLWSMIAPTDVRRTVNRERRPKGQFAGLCSIWSGTSLVFLHRPKSGFNGTTRRR